MKTLSGTPIGSWNSSGNTSVSTPIPPTSCSGRPTAGPRRLDTASEVALVLRGHSRTRGEIGPFLLRRVWDAEGEPLGYERVTPAPALLKNPEQEAAFLGLPDAFQFRDAMRLYGKRNE